MTLKLISPPINEAVSIELLRSHLRVREGEDGDVLRHCLQTAIAQFDGAEGELGRALIDQTWRETFTSVPGRCSSLELRLLPVSSIESVQVFNVSGVWEDVPESAVELFENDGRWHVSALQPWPASGSHRAPVRIEYVAGYGATAEDVPKPIAHAILLFAAHLYEVREPVSFEGSPVEVPISISRLVAGYRVWWF